MKTSRFAMNTTFRHLALAALVALLSTACSREQAVVTADNPLLGYVPSDSPYLAANLEPLPADIADVYLQRAQPVFDEMQAQLTAAREDLEGRVSSTGGDTETRIALALLQELDGKLSREGLAGLGIDILSPKVVYGVGAFPVMRSGLADADLLRASVQRVLDTAGVSAPEQVLQGVSYWRIDPEEAEESPVAIYLSILPDHLAVGVLPTAAESQLLPAFLGLERPLQSDAGSRLAALNREHGYTPHGSGIVDLKLLADEFLLPDRLTAGVMADLGAYDAAAIAPECISEVHGILDNMPRMTAGTVELTADAVAYQYRLETPPTLAERLLDLVARLPMAEAASSRMLDLAFGMRFGALRDFVREKAEAIVQNPYRCEQLQGLNTQAQNALVKLDQPMLPFINNFRGLRLSLDELDIIRGSLPAGARGYLGLHVEQPQMFLGMAQMFLPNLAELGLQIGEPPVRLPEDLFPVPGVVAFAALTSEAIGISLGEGEETGLSGWLEARQGPEGMFLSLSYDTVAYLDLTEQFTGDDSVYREDVGSMHDKAGGPEALAAAARKAYREMADRSETTMTFAPDGLVIEGRMTFQPLP